MVLESHLEVRRFPGDEGVRWHGPTRSERGGAYARKCSKCGKLVSVASYSNKWGKLVGAPAW